MNIELCLGLLLYCATLPRTSALPIEAFDEVLSECRQLHRWVDETPQSACHFTRSLDTSKHLARRDLPPGTVGGIFLGSFFGFFFLVLLVVACCAPDLLRRGGSEPSIYTESNSRSPSPLSPLSPPSPSAPHSPSPPPKQSSRRRPPMIFSTLQPSKPRPGGPSIELRGIDGPDDEPPTISVVKPRPKGPDGPSGVPAASMGLFFRLLPGEILTQNKRRGWEFHRPRRRPVHIDPIPEPSDSTEESVVYEEVIPVPRSRTRSSRGRVHSVERVRPGRQQIVFEDR